MCGLYSLLLWLTHPSTSDLHKTFAQYKASNLEKYVKWKEIKFIPHLPHQENKSPPFDLCSPRPWKSRLQINISLAIAPPHRNPKRARVTFFLSFSPHPQDQHIKVQAGREMGNQGGIMQITSSAAAREPRVFKLSCCSLVSASAGARSLVRKAPQLRSCRKAGWHLQHQSRFFNAAILRSG